MYWIVRNKALSKIPNAHGPYNSQSSAELAAKGFPPGEYNINDGETYVSRVTISQPQVSVEKIPQSKEALPTSSGN